MSGQRTNPSTPSQSGFRSALPTPTGIARRTSLARSIGTGTSPVDSPDTAYKKQSLAEAISRNDPAKYRLQGNSPSSAKDDSDRDANSPMLVPGKLPRPGVVARKSTMGLKTRSETPTGLPTPSSQLSPASTAHTRASSATSSVEGSSIPSPGSRTKLDSPLSASDITRARSPMALSQRANSSLTADSTFARGYATPKRLSVVHSQASTSSAVSPGYSSHAAPTIASKARESSAAVARRGRDLEIGDLVKMESSELVGVLRHLGPVQFKPGYYAGLELTGDSVGKGKNDGSVGGIQYFACAPRNGVFCPASKVIAISEEPPTDAVARPASAMSSRSGKSSDVFDRPPSTTPGRRRANTISRPPSTTPSRSSSRAGVRLLSVTPGSRPASALSASRPSSRLTDRKSMGTMPSMRNGQDNTKAFEDPRSRAPGMVSSRLGGSPVKPRPSSPLKGSLLGARANGDAVRTPRSSLSSIPPPAFGDPSTPGLPKARKSIGPGVPTPRATKARVSMFGRPPGGSAAGMPPPPSPTKDGAQRPASSLSVRSSSRLGYDADDNDNADNLVGDMTVSGPQPGRNSRLDRAQNLLEAMDLTPKRAAPSSGSGGHRGSSMSRYADPQDAYPDEADDDLANESVAEAVVPLSLYEEQMNELEKLRVHVESLEKQNHTLLKAQESRKARMSEIRSNESVLEEERAKMRAEARERESEMEEERKMEREDEVRRRKEIEDREKELKEKLDEAIKALTKLADEHEKAKSDHESQRRDLEGKAQESQRLVEEMKKSLETQTQQPDDGEGKAALEVKIKVKDAEIESLEASCQRLESELQRERKELGIQIDELKDAGRETISLYEQRIEEVERENCDLLEKMKLLEQRAQEAIAAAESKYDFLLAQQVNGGSSGRSAGATEIDNENLREQVAHLQDKVGNYEDQIAEAALSLEKEKEYSQKRRDKSSKVETSLKDEIKRVRAEVERLVKSDKDGRERLEEMHHALEESKTALERERAELEALRADVENIESLNGRAHKRVVAPASDTTSETSSFKSADNSEAKKPAVPKPTAPASATSDADEPCDDCGEVGHRFEDCPYINELF